MSIFLVKTEKFAAGEYWQNTYGVELYASIAEPEFSNQEPSLSDSDVQALTSNGLAPITAATTDPTDPNFVGGSGILHAIVAFERLLTASFIQFTKLSLTNGLEGLDEAITFPLNFFGLLSPGAGGGANVVPGNVTLSYVKSTSQVSYRNGRSFLRGSLLDGDVSFDGFRLVSLTDPAGVQARVLGAANDSELSRYLLAGATIFGSDSAARLGVPRYSPRNPSNPLAGSLVGMSQWATIGTIKATGRQVQRGRRRQP